MWSGYALETGSNVSELRLVYDQLKHIKDRFSPIISQMFHGIIIILAHKYTINNLGSTKDACATSIKA
jgi:hypothetical protein